MNKEFKPISRNVLLKEPIKVIYGKDNYSIYSYRQTLKIIENEDEVCETIISIEDRYFIYKKLTDNWFRKKKAIRLNM